MKSSPDLARELLAGSLADAACHVAERTVSSVDLTEAAIERSTQVHETLNCYIELRPDAALQQARRADALLEAGTYLGPLHGIPLAHKDIFYRAGERTTAGSALLADFRPDRTSPVLERLDASGAVDLGTLNLAEFCVGPTGQNDHTGDCRNPFDTAHISGGSSSGSGAAVAARAIFGSIGSDTGGSIRMPAGICGVCGLKPSRGRVSLRNAVERCWSLDVFGPLARSVPDLSILMNAIAGYDADDVLSVPAPVPDYLGGLDTPVAPARIGVPEDLFDSLEPAVAERHRVALEAFARAGYAIEMIAMPDTAALYDLTTVINNVEATFLHRDAIGTQPDAFNPSTLSRINRGYGIDALAYVEATRRQAVERHRFTRDVLEGRAALYLPLLEMEVPTIKSVAFSDAQGADTIVPRLTRWTRWVSYLGLPALTLPIGLSPSGLPVACQLLGAYMAEETLLRVGATFQRETAWHAIAPTVP